VVRRSRKPAENAAHREKGHLWMGASYAKLLRGPHGPGRQPPLRKVLEHHKGILACRVKGLLHLTRDKPAFAEKPLARDIVCGCVKNQCLHSNLPGPFLYLLDEKMADAAVPSGRFYGDGQHFRHDGKIELTLKSAEHDEPSWSLFRQGQMGHRGARLKPARHHLFVGAILAKDPLAQTPDIIHISGLGRTHADPICAGFPGFVSAHPSPHPGRVTARTRSPAEGQVTPVGLSVLCGSDKRMLDLCAVSLVSIEQWPFFPPIWRSELETSNRADRSTSHL